LKAVTLLAEIQHTFGKGIKVAELFVDPTPAAMAEVISGIAAYSDARDFIPVQPQGTRPPFFLIGGDHYFRPLARSMGLDQPFVGVPLLKYRHLDIGKSRLSIAKELAHLLVQQHHGAPFLLGGWCADGLTAYEVGRALIEQGESVSLVVLFDAVNPDYYRETRSLIHSAGRTMTSLRRIIELATTGGPVARVSGVAKAIGPLVRRLGQRIADTYNNEKPDLGWSRACGNFLTVVEVPGDHSSIFREPNVRILGWKVRQQLDAALSRMRQAEG
jgi:thioesterase domain-containing protein